MYLTHLSLTNFRLFSRLDMDVPRRVLLLQGENAQGKTSLLEAIYFLATFTSFHAQSDRQLVNFLATREALAVTRMVGTYQRGEKIHKLEVRLIQDSNGNGGARLRKETLLDGVKTPPNQLVGHFSAVIFLPQMTRIIEEGPDERRRYLNLAVAQGDPFFTQTLSEFNNAISQRNALLKMLSERGGDQSQMEYWDELITNLGARIIQARVAAIREIDQIAVRIHDKLTGSKEVLRLIYQPSFDPLPKPNGQIALPIQTPINRDGFSLDQIQKGYLAQLKSIRADEIMRGVTTIGPHRDELRIQSNGIDLTDFGSRGQIRTALLSLKLAEVEWLKQKTTQWPVLLLDEIMAELDLQRRKFLMDYLQDAEQTIMTTTDLHLFTTSFTESCEKWTINSGSVVHSEKS
jgi:DNA replication and repair protein RecF